MGTAKVPRYYTIRRHWSSHLARLVGTMEVRIGIFMYNLLVDNVYSMTTLLDHKTTLAYLAYLGYPAEPRTEALQVTRPRKTDRRKGKVTRNVFLCYICGAAGSGKTSLLRAFAGKSFDPVYEPTSKMISVVNSVDIDGSEKYLIVSFKNYFYTL
jgi:EF hand associated